MAITAETRNDIIELVVTALDAAPGTTMLTELVAIADGGGSLADVADAIASSANFTNLYPSFLTAEEFATNWLGTLVPEAGEDALAEGIAVAVGLINSGASFGSILIEAQSFLSAISEDDTSFGTSAANFNNKVEVATYHTVTLKQDSASLAGLQNALANVTSDDDSVTAANAELDSGGGSVTGTTTFTLTDSIDTISGTAGNDLVIGDNATASTADTLEMGEGTDTIRLFQTVNLPSLNSVEKAEFYNLAAAATIDTTNSSSLTSVLIRNSALTGDIDVILANDESLTLTNVTGNHAIDVDTDAVPIYLDGVSGSGSDTDLDVAGTETLTLIGQNNSSDVDLVDAGNGLETVILQGSVHLDVENLAITSLETIDASATTAGTNIEIGAASDVTFTGGTGSDDIDIVASVLDEDDSFDGGEGADEFEISNAGTDNITGGDLNITNFEELRLNADVTADVTYDFDNVVGLTQTQMLGSLVPANASHNITLRDIATSVTTINFFSIGSLSSLYEDVDIGFDGIIMDYDSTSEVAAVTINVTNLGVSGADYTINQIGVANVLDVTLNVADADEVIVTNALIASAAESITIAGTSDVTLTGGITGSTDLESIDASGATGDVSTGTISAIADEANITTGDGDDTIVLAAGTNGATIDAGAGNDSVDVSNDTNNIVTLGSGTDTLIIDSAADTNVEVTDFSAGQGGDILDLDTNEATGTGITATTYVETSIDATGAVAGAASGGFHVVVDSNGAAFPTDLTPANVAAFLADLDGAGAGTSSFSFANSDNVLYIAVTDGTDTAIFKADDTNADTVIDANDLTLLVTLTDVDDPTDLAPSNLSDFL